MIPFELRSALATVARLRARIDEFPVLTDAVRAKMKLADELLASVDGPGVGLEESRTRAYAMARLMKEHGFEVAYANNAERLGIVYDLLDTLSSILTYTSKLLDRR